MPRLQPLYIAFEGGEGSGKSTQARLLAEKIGAVTTFEPGGTPTGQELRRLLLDPSTGELDPSTELLLMAADRHQLMAEVVEPNLSSGRSVVSDRSFISSLAYQGAARDLGVDTVLDINLRLGKVRMPDLLFLLEPPAMYELEKRMGEKGGLDKIEVIGNDFHKKVAEAFGQMGHTLANDSRTEGIHVEKVPQTVQGSQYSPDQVHDDIFNRLTEFCSQQGIIVPTPTN